MKKIILLGDSIRKGYDTYTRMAFDGVAEVWYPDENCRFAAYTLRYLYNWKSKSELGDDVDCVHWNAGLWDCLMLASDGECLTPIEIYEYYIDRICRNLRMLFPCAKIIFATSTPVLEELYTDFKRKNCDIERYNAAAVAIVKKYGFVVNDLYATAGAAPASVHSDMTHFYTMEGTRLITTQVVSCIEECLGIRGTLPDFEALFADKDKVEGI